LNWPNSRRASAISLLPALLRVGALVVAAQEQNDLLPVEVHEHPEQHLLRLAIDLGRLASEHAGNLVGVVAHSELVESLAERLQPLGPDEVDPSDREHPIDGGVEGDELEVGENVDEPLERDGPVVGLEGLRCPVARHASRKLHGWHLSCTGLPRVRRLAREVGARMAACRFPPRSSESSSPFVRPRPVDVRAT
jgi:hypothetical protein